jgi:TonB family protein
LEKGPLGVVRVADQMLTEPADAEYPPSERAQGRDASVILRLDIDPEGHVARALIHESGGAAFDDAARAAALRLRFVPARRGARAIAARILHRVDFRLADPAPTDGGLGSGVADEPPRPTGDDAAAAAGTSPASGPSNGPATADAP